MYDAKNLYTLCMAMKQPFMGNPYAHKMQPHYHADSSPTSPVMGIMGHTIYQHHGTVGSALAHRGFARYSGSEFPPGITITAMLQLMVLWRTHLHRDSTKVLNNNPLLLICHLHHQHLACLERKLQGTQSSLQHQRKRMKPSSRCSPKFLRLFKFVTSYQHGIQIKLC